MKAPRILVAVVESNRRVLTLLWLELIEEGRRDGSIRTEYAKELSELLPLGHLKRLRCRRVSRRCWQAELRDGFLMKKKRREVRDGQIKKH